MKMFVTRLGFNSKAVITGDITQIDLPNPGRSGLVEAIEVLRDVEGIRFCHFDEGDVVRHHLVQRIVRAYEDYKGRNEQLSFDLKGSATIAPPRVSNGGASTTAADREASLAEVPPPADLGATSRISE
jgi:phosphate starvation-inducible PhoH-like protein